MKKIVFTIMMFYVVFFTVPFVFADETAVKVIDYNRLITNYICADTLNMGAQELFDDCVNDHRLNRVSKSGYIYMNLVDENSKFFLKWAGWHYNGVSKIRYTCVNNDNLKSYSGVFYEGSLVDKNSALEGKIDVNKWNIGNYSCQTEDNNGYKKERINITIHANGENSYGDEITTVTVPVENNCSEYGSFIEDLQSIFNVFKIVAPILALALSTYDFFISITSKDGEGYKKAFGKLKTRLILVVLLYAMPVILNILLEIIISPNATTCIK